jgi:hypothetical protein
MPEMIVKTTTTVTDPGRRTMLETGSLVVMSAFLTGIVMIMENAIAGPSF